MILSAFWPFIAWMESSTYLGTVPYCTFFEHVLPRNVVDSIQAINGQNADKIIGLTLFVCF